MKLKHSLEFPMGEVIHPTPQHRIDQCDAVRFFIFGV
jgi:hypothetical protein